MNDFKKRVLIGARRYLEIRGYDIIGSFNDFIVCDTEEGYVFVHVVYSVDSHEFPKTEIEDLRKLFEEAIVHWFLEEGHDDVLDIPLQCDEIQMLCMGDRAIIRHLINAIESGTFSINEDGDVDEW